MSDDSSSDEGSVTIADAYVSASSGIAVGDSTTTAPDQIYVEFSYPVMIDGAEGAAVPADGFRVDGTAAGVETVRRASTVANSEEAPGSRVLMLSLSMGIAANEQPKLSYSPASGDITTATGTAPDPVDSLEVTPGSPRVLDAAIPAGAGDRIRITFDRPVESRTGDASMFSVTGGSGNRLLSGEISTDGNRVTLPLNRDVTEGAIDADGELTLQYRASGSDTERMRNLIGQESALVQAFAEPIAIEVASGGFSIVEASVPLSPNSSGNVEHSRIGLRFEPPMTAKSAAGYELEGSLAQVQGLESPGSGTDAPHVMLDLDAPVDPEQGDQATVHYSPERGDTRAAGNEVPEQPLSAPVEHVGSTPTALSAELTPSRDAVAVEFTRPIRSQTNDTTGMKLTGVGDISLTGAVSEGQTMTLELSDPIELRDIDNTVSLAYSTQSDSGRRLNLLAANDGVPVESFKLEVDPAGGSPTVKHARIPEGSRDCLWVRFDRPVRAGTAAGFSLEGSVARIDRLGSADDLSDSLVPYTLVFDLHVEAQTDSATVVYDAEAGNVDSRDGEPVESFEQSVDMLPPAPTMTGAVVDGDGSAVRVSYDRAVTLNRNDATGFSLTYGIDADGLATLTGQASADGTDVMLETDSAVDIAADPVVSYQPDDEVANVLGANEGVPAEETTVHVEGAASGDETEHEDESCDDGDADDDSEDGTDGDDDESHDEGETHPPELLSAEVPTESGDSIVCHFDGPVDPDSGRFEIEGSEAAIIGIIDHEDTTHELTLELNPALEPNDEPVISYTVDH